MTVTGAPPGIPSASRLAGWIGGGPGGAPFSLAGLGLTLVGRAGPPRGAGRDISRIGSYVAFGYLKLAVVLKGIYGRFLPHRTVGDGLEHEGLAIPTLAARAHQVLGADD